MTKIIFAILLCLMVSCTQNQRAKELGGTYTINLEHGKKLEMITWKNDSLWILTRDARSGEKEETHTLKEDSSLGIMEGKVIIVENL